MMLLKQTQEMIGTPAFWNLRGRRAQACRILLAA